VLQAQQEIEDEVNLSWLWVLLFMKSVMMIGAVCSSCLGGKLMRLSPVQSEKSFF
jgi:Na+/citrate or Na+/malate symporter